MVVLRFTLLIALLFTSCTVSSRFEKQFADLYCEYQEECNDADLQDCLDRSEERPISECAIITREMARDCLVELKKARKNCDEPPECDIFFEGCP